MLKLLGKAESALSKAEIKMEIHSRQCVRLRHKSSGCNICTDYCSGEAIQIGSAGGEIEVNWERCYDCGICCNVCPTDVFQSLAFDDQLFLQRCLDKAETDLGVTITCSQSSHADAEREEVIQCLGIVKVEHLLMLNAATVDRIIFKSADCLQCRNRCGLTLLKNNLKEVNLLLSAFEGAQITFVFSSETTSPSISKEKELSPRLHSQSGGSVSRRFFFKQMTEKSRKTATSALHQLYHQNPDNKVVEKPLIKKLPPSRTLLIAAIVNLRGREVHQVDLSKSQRLALLQIDELKCQRCGICHLFCPTGALRPVRGSGGDDKESDFGLDFKPLNCVKCGLCAAGCSSGAIRYSEKVSSTAVFSGIDQRLISWNEPPPKVRKFELDRIITRQGNV